MICMYVYMLMFNYTIWMHVFMCCFLHIQSRSHTAGHKPDLEKKKQHALYHYLHSGGKCPYYYDTDLVFIYVTMLFT